MEHPWVRFDRYFSNECLNCDQLIAYLRKIYCPASGASTSVPMDKDGYLPLSTLIILD